MGFIPAGHSQLSHGRALWETYAFSQIQRHLLSQGINNPPLYYWRTKDGKEIDFIIEKGGQFIAIELN